MNKIIKQFLVEDGFLEPESEMDYNYEDQVSYIYHVCNKLKEQRTIKVVHNKLGEREYSSQLKGFRCFPKFVPEPFKYLNIGGKEFLFQECVLHRSLLAKHIYTQRHVWAIDLPFFFTNKIEDLISSNRDVENDYQILLEELKPSLPSSIYISARKMLAAHDLGKYKLLPPRAQHGDFSINNLGVRDGGLIIFDWENFGISHTYGLDFTVFIASAVDHNEKEIIQFLDGKGPGHLERLRKTFVTDCSLQGEELMPLFAMCYTIFFTMKKNLGYADEIIIKVNNVLQNLFTHYGHN